MTTKIDPKDVQVGDSVSVTLTGTVVHVYSDMRGVKIDFGSKIEIIERKSLRDAVIERPVDPDLIKAREIADRAIQHLRYYPEYSERNRNILNGGCDNGVAVRAALAGIKAGREQ